MLTFYTHPQSRGRIARWLLEEVGQPYETVALSFEEMKTETFRAVNPFGKVPAVLHDGRLITEGAAICAYMAETFPEADLAPRKDERAGYFRWMFFMAGPCEAAVTDRALGVAPTPEQRRFVGYASYDEMVDMLERAVTEHPYVAGERFTAADVYFGGQVMTGVALGSLPSRPAFADYRDRLASRPAYRRATAMDDALAAEFG